MALPYNRLRNDVRLFLYTAIALTIIGLIFIYSSSSIYALEKFGVAHYFVKKQLFFAGLSCVGFFIFALVPLIIWERWASLLFLGSLSLTLLTFIPFFGIKFHGSHRWLSILGFGFQPSELLKLFLFMYIGFFLGRRQSNIRSFLYTYLPLLMILGVVSFILLKQPDFGSAVTIFLTTLTLFFVAECKMLYVAITALCACPLALYLVLTKAYRLKRILIFLNPWADPQGSGFQIIQSLIAIGTGQFWGVGISNSKQKFFYLPMQHTDFIFPIIAEEVGFIGSIILIFLYIIFCFFGLRIALSLQAPFAFFTTLSFVVFITLQSVINLMVTCGLLPTKGLGLPFVSYGGTALVCLWCMMGFIVNCVRTERS